MSFFPNDLEQYINMTVATGESVTADSFVEIINGGVRTAKATTNDTFTHIAQTSTIANSVGVNYIKALKLDCERILIVYQNSSGYCAAAIITISKENGQTTYGAPVNVVATANSNYCDAILTGSSSALVVVGTATSASYGTVRALSITGTTITVGTALVFETSYVMNSPPSIVKVSENNKNYYLIVYGNINYLYGVVVSHTGTTAPVIVTSKFNIRTGKGWSALVKTVSETKVIVTYINASDTLCFNTIDFPADYLTAPTVGTEVATVSCSGIRGFEKTISDKNYIIVYNNTTQFVVSSLVFNSSYVYSSITNTATFYEAGTVCYTPSVNLKKLSDDIFLLTANLTASYNDAYQYVHIASDNTLLITTQTLFTNSAQRVTRVQDMIIIDDYFIGIGKDDLSGYIYTVTKSTTKNKCSNVIGISKDTAASGETVKVNIGTLVSGFTGLEIGSYYYMTKDGLIKTYHGLIDEPTGIAISSDTIRLYKKIIQ
jgi:hypothetical protein